MPVDIVAIISPVAGKESEAETLLNELAAKIVADEPGAIRYKPYKQVGQDGATKFVVVER